MSTLRKAVIGTLVLWSILVAGYAYAYVTGRSGLASAQGYEAEWDWQLFFFAITRFPILLAALGVALWLERKYLGQSQR